MIFRSLASPDPVRRSKRRRRRRKRKKKKEKKKKKRKKRKKQNYICTLPIDRPWRKILVKKMVECAAAAQDN